jgi:hypothetical protein
MLITYRRTGGILALLALAAVAFAAAVLTVAVATTILFVAFAVAAAVRLTLAVLPTSWWHRAVPPETRWPQETIEATVVEPTSGSSSDERDSVRMDQR